MKQKMAKFTYNKINESEHYHLYNYEDDSHYKVGQKEIDLLLTIRKNVTAGLPPSGANDDPEMKEHLQKMKELHFLTAETSSIKKKLSIKTSQLRKTFLTKGVEFLFFAFAIILPFSKRNLLALDQLFRYLHHEQMLIIASIGLFSLFISILVHEYAHLIFSVNRDVMVPSIGWRLFSKGKKGVYIDTTGMQFLAQTTDKIAIHFAGPFAHLSLASFGLCLVPFSVHGLYFLNLFAVLNFILFIANLCPFFKTDGQEIARELFNH